MLHILLSILKITGMIFLVILAILLLLVLLVLFVPVRYRAEAQIGDDKSVHARIHWLLRMFGAEVAYANKMLTVRAKLFWFIPIQIVPAKPKKEKPVKKPVQKKKIKNPPVQSLPEQQTQTISELFPSNSTITEDAAVGQERSVLSEESKGIRKLFGLPGKIQKKISSIFQKVKYTIKAICDKITQVKGQVDYYLELLQREQTKQAFGLCKGELFKILKHISPRKISGEFLFGLDDPAATGQIYGIYCAAVMLHNNRVRLIPDFDRKIVDGWIKIRGRIRGITFVNAALKIIFDKNIQYWIKTLKHKTGGTDHGIR